MMDFCRQVGCKAGGRLLVVGPQILNGEIISSANKAIVRPIIAALVNMARMMFHRVTGRSNSEESERVIAALLTRSSNTSRIT